MLILISIWFILVIIQKWGERHYLSVQDNEFTSHTIDAPILANRAAEWARQLSDGQRSMEMVKISVS